MITEEIKQSKILELANLIFQYNSGERENINANEFKNWELISTMLKQADIAMGIYEDFLTYPTHYKIEGNEIVLNENWEEEERQAELHRIGNLHITKQDFYLYLCKPAGVDYDTLLAKINELNMRAEWDLCNHIYYGIIQPFLSSLPLGKTDDEIIAVFEKYCKE